MPEHAPNVRPHGTQDLVQNERPVPMPDRTLEHMPNKVPKFTP